MQSEESPSDAFKVNLDWPQGSPGNPPVPVEAPREPTSERVEPQAPPEVPTVGAAALSLAADVASGVRAEALERALSEITMRLDALSMATTSFRSLVSDRFTDYADQVARAQSITARDFEDSRREYERTVHDLERALRESDDGLRWLQRGIQQLAGRLDQVVTANVVEHLGERLQGVVEQVGENLHAVVGDSTRVVSTEIQAARAELANRAETWSTESAERSRLVSDQLGSLNDQLQALADRREDRVGARVEEVLAAVERLSLGVEHVERLVQESSMAARAALTPANFEPLRASLERIEQAARDWPDPDRLGHSLERLDALADATEDQSELLGTLRRVETIVAALADASDDNAVVARIDEQFDAINQALDQSVRSEGRDAALAALDAQLGHMESLLTRAVTPDRAESPDSDTFRRLEDAVERLAAAQAEDLERILEAVEAKSEETAAPQRRPGDTAVAEQLGLLVTQIEGLRRRIALRARPAPALDEATIEALAAAVAERLHAASLPVPTEAPPRRRVGGGAKPLAPPPDTRAVPAAHDESSPRRAGVRTRKQSS